MPAAERMSRALEYRYSDYGSNGSSFPATPDGPHEFTTDRLTVGSNWAL